MDINDIKNEEKIGKIINGALKTKRYCIQSMIKSHKNVVCYGLGKVFESIFLERDIKDKCNVNYLADIDTRKQGKIFYGLPVIAPEKIKDMEDVIVIVCMEHMEEVEKMFNFQKIPYVGYAELVLEISRDREVSEEDFLNNQIMETYHLLSDRKSREIYIEILAKRLAPHLSEYSWNEIYSDTVQYFDQELFALHENECYVDGGAYNGDSLREFLKTVGKFEAAYCFEIARDNYDKLVQYVSTLGNRNIYCYNAGIWSEKGIINFGNENTSGGVSYSIFKKKNTEKASVDKLDEFLKNKKVTFIKMDIEGAELDALKGTENIIVEQKPKLAVCLYHRIDDFWKIPVYLKKLYEGYHFGIRHYSKGFLDTILYAYTK